MKKFKKIILSALCLVLALSTFTACGEENVSYELSHYSYAECDADMFNKDLFYANTLQANMGDPTMLVVEEDGKTVFYATGTQTGFDFRMWRSEDLTEWENIGVVYTPDENSFVYKDHWAPNILWDPEADWQYYLGEDAGEGKGLYCLFFSGRISASGPCQLQCAFSKEATGPYTVPNTVNANGDKYDSSNYLFDIEKLNGLNLWAGTAYGERYGGDLYGSHRGFIDAYPLIDPVSGDKYLYFVKSRSGGDKSNDVWGVKMKDWISPDYPTTTPLSCHGYVDVTLEEDYDWQMMVGGWIDEGPVMIYRDFTDDGVDNGTYYLTLSLGGTGDKFYSPIQALSDSPLGLFEKVQPQDGGFICVPGIDWDVVASGHHDLVMIGNELYNVYHTYKIYSSTQIGKRFLACDKVEFIENDLGQMVMHTNGPSKVLQALPELVSGYKNVARDAKVSATNKDGSDAKLLNDGLVALGKGIVEDEEDAAKWLPKEFTTSKSSTTITLTFDEWVTARAIMVYNSYDIDKAFAEIEKIEFTIKDGTAFIKKLGFNEEANRVPYSYFFDEEELSNEWIQEELATGYYDVMRPLGAAVAEFDEIQIKEVKITIKKARGKSGIGIPEIMILGKTA